jgi:hypothetical protein
MFARAFAAESMHTFCRRLVDNVIRFLDVESRDVIDFPCSDGRARPTAPSHSISRRFRAAATICCGQACASSVATPIS